MPYEVLHGDITKIKADAIVNAANTGLHAGGGVCGAIFRAAGRERLVEACSQLGGVRTGEAVCTPAFDLPAKYIIHTAGPVWHGGNAGEPRLLASSYRSSLNLAAQKGCRSIAFPLISSGIYGYPKELAQSEAEAAIMDYLKKDPEMQVMLVLFD